MQLQGSCFFSMMLCSSERLPRCYVVDKVFWVFFFAYCLVAMVSLCGISTVFLACYYAVVKVFWIVSRVLLQLDSC